MALAPSLACLLCASVLLAPVSAIGSFRKPASTGKVHPRQMQRELMAALHVSLTTMGSGGMDIHGMGRRIRGTFGALPKNDNGRLDGTSVRYLAHTFFQKEYGWLVRGLDPHAAPSTVNITSSIPHDRNNIPAFLLSILEEKYKGQGMGPGASVAFMALLGNLILHEGIGRLDAAYSLNGLFSNHNLSQDELELVLDSYMVLLSSETSDAQNKEQHNDVRAKLHTVWSEFPQMQAFSSDTVKNIAFVKGDRANPFRKRTYSFEDAVDVMTAVSQRFGKVRDLQCHQLKDGLTKMDPSVTGRIMLRHFYEKETIGSWNLMESVEYLRELGALDESAPSLGPQLIISNYVTAVSNCDSPSEYFSICCIHECGDLLNHIETNIQAPSANPDDILSLVVNMSSDTVEAPRNLTSALGTALQHVARLHNGEVPLHSRLFAQWMHYAFPHECPYPFAAGKINPLTPTEWLQQRGRGADASKEEVAAYRQQKTEEGEAMKQLYMSQWTDEEESLLTAPLLDLAQKGGSNMKAVLQVASFIFGPVMMLLGMLRPRGDVVRAIFGRSPKVPTKI